MAALLIGCVGRDTSRADQRGQRRQKLARPDWHFRPGHLAGAEALILETLGEGHPDLFYIKYAMTNRANELRNDRQALQLADETIRIARAADPGGSRHEGFALLGLASARRGVGLQWEALQSLRVRPRCRIEGLSTLRRSASDSRTLLEHAVERLGPPHRQRGVRRGEELHSSIGGWSGTRAH